MTATASMRPISRSRNGTLPETCLLRQCTYLNNVMEYDHRLVKRRVNPGMGFEAFTMAQRYIQGYEAMHRLRKGQIKGLPSGTSPHRAGLSTSCSGWPHSENSSISPHPSISFCNTTRKSGRTPGPTLPLDAELPVGLQYELMRGSLLDPMAARLRTPTMFPLSPGEGILSWRCHT
jgi:DDE domain